MLTAAGVGEFHLYAKFPMPFAKLGVPPTHGGIHAWWGTYTLGVLLVLTPANLVLFFPGTDSQHRGSAALVDSWSLDVVSGAEARNMVQF